MYRNTKDFLEKWGDERNAGLPGFRISQFKKSFLPSAEVFLFLLVFYNYYIAYKRGAKLGILEISLMASFMGLLLLTNINPFINNPIGISFFIILLVLSQNKKDSWSKEIK